MEKPDFCLKGRRHRTIESRGTLKSRAFQSPSFKALVADNEDIRTKGSCSEVPRNCFCVRHCFRCGPSILELPWHPRKMAPASVFTSVRGAGDNRNSLLPRAVFSDNGLVRPSVLLGSPSPHLLCIAYAVTTEKESLAQLAGVVVPYACRCIASLFYFSI